MNKKQLKYDTAYLKMAQEWSKLSHCSRKQVGALLVRDGMIISELLVILHVNICLGIVIISEIMFLKKNSLNITRITLVPA